MLTRNNKNVNLPLLSLHRIQIPCPDNHKVQISQMQSTKTFNNLLLMLVISSSTATAQSINTSTVNFAGGTYIQGYFQFDWGIGEGASIETFKNSNNYLSYSIP